MTAVSQCVDNSLIRKYSPYYCWKYLCYWLSMLSSTDRGNLFIDFALILIAPIRKPMITVSVNFFGGSSQCRVICLQIHHAINTRLFDVKLRKVLLLLIFEPFGAVLWQSAVLCSGFVWLPNERSILMRFLATTKSRNRMFVRRTWSEHIYHCVIITRARAAGTLHFVRVIVCISSGAQHKHQRISLFSPAIKSTPAFGNQSTTSRSLFFWFQSFEEGDKMKSHTKLLRTNFWTIENIFSELSIPNNVFRMIMFSFLWQPMSNEWFVSAKNWMPKSLWYWSHKFIICYYRYSCLCSSIMHSCEGLLEYVRVCRIDGANK